MLLPLTISIFGSLGNLIGTLWLARLSTPDEFGQVIALVAMIEIIYLVNNLGFNTLIMQNNNEGKHEIFKAIINISLVILGVCFIFTNYMFYENEFQLLILLYSFSKIFYCIGALYQSVGRRENNYKSDSIILLVIDFFSYFIAVLYSYLTEEMVISIMLRYVSKNLLFSIYIYKYFSYDALVKSQTFYRQVFENIKLLSINNISYQIREHLEKIIIFKFYGTNFLGIYERGRNIAEFGPNVILSFFRNYLITMGKEKDSEFYFKKYELLLSFAMVIVSFIIVTFNIKPIFTIDLLLGSNWHELAKSLHIYSSVAISFSLTILLRTVFLSLKKNRMARNNSLLYVFTYITIIFTVALLKVNLIDLIITLSIYHNFFSLYLIFKHKYEFDLRFLRGSYIYILLSLGLLLNNNFINYFLLVVAIFEFLVLLRKKVFNYEKS